MQASSWPPRFDAVHSFSVCIGGSDEMSLSLTTVPNARAAALLPLWRMQYEAAGRNASSEGHDILMGSTTTVFGAYMNGLGEDADGLALVRFESHGIGGDGRCSRVMLVDALFASPTLPETSRATLQSAMRHALCALGQAHEMSVTYEGHITLLAR